MKGHIKKLAVTGLFVAPVTAMADGFTKAQGLLDKISTGLLALSIVTVTIATLWVGYKVLFGGQTLRECAPIIIGAILIASASEIARLLVG
ncbi:hypothetical protein Pfra02_44470 [Pseudomonas fragi]|nr:hypothetical protein Pfra02_44470 [Pseudomonas fragi]